MSKGGSMPKRPSDPLKLTMRQAVMYAESLVNYTKHETLTQGGYETKQKRYRIPVSAYRDTRFTVIAHIYVSDLPALGQLPRVWRVDVPRKQRR